MKLCLISNSTNAGEAYLGWPQEYIKDFLNKNGVKKVLFVPFAGVSLSDEGLQKSYDVYAERVRGVFSALGFELESVHQQADGRQAVRDAECVVVGGGNTFHLYYEMHRLGLMSEVRERARAGMPYMGWSAGSNLACPTLKTTNDMPIIEPASFNGLNLVPFQINPHYLDANPAGHGGETREQRIEEFLTINRKMDVIGLREACLFEVDGDEFILKGNKSMRIFQFGKEYYEVEAGDDLNFLKK